MRMRLIWFALPYPAAAQPSPGCHCPVYSMSSVCDGHVLVSTEDKGTESQKKKTTLACKHVFVFISSSTERGVIPCHPPVTLRE